MPTGTKKSSDSREHHHVEAVQVLIGTAAITKSGILPDIERLTIASFLALITSHAALADSGDSDANNSLSRIIVTSTRTPENESQIGSAFSQLTAEELETEQVYNLKQALNTTPGLFLLETGASGGFTTVSIRDSDPSYSLILVDGIRVNTGIFDNADPFLAYAQTFNLDTIEVFRGPYSTLYGSDAIGGVISAATHKGSGPPKVPYLGKGEVMILSGAGVTSGGVVGKIAWSAGSERPSGGYFPDREYG